jgi:Ice-binding-like
VHGGWAQPEARRPLRRKISPTPEDRDTHYVRPPATTTTTGQAPVNVGTAGSFAILTKSGITDVPSSKITGDVGASPITGAAIGLTCAEVTGGVFSADASGPLPCRVTAPSTLTTAVSNMQTAYTDAAGRTNPTAVNLGGGDIGGMTLAPGLYKWSTNLGISKDVTLAGGANQVWIFQISGTLNQASAT